MIPFPPLDEDAIREEAIQDLFDRLERGHDKVVDAAQEHGAKLYGGDADWRTAERALRDRKTEWALLVGDARRAILHAIADVQVIHDREASAS